MADIQFGSGVAAFNPSAVNAALLQNPTPMSPSLVQEMSVDFKADEKQLFGRGQWAVDTARGQIKSTGKGKIGSTDPVFMNQLYFGMPATAGTTRPVDSEVHTLAAGTTATITPTNITGGSSFVADLGVVNGVTALVMYRVDAAPTVGQYSVNLTTGAYTFNAAETATTVLISYSYQDTVNGVTISISSQNNGYSPEFELHLFNNYRGKLFCLHLLRCKLSDISIASKQSDYWMSDFSYTICANDAGQVGYIYADR